MNLQSIIDSVDHLPPTARVFVNLQQLLRDHNASTDEVVELVRMDAHLTAQILKVSNSAYYGAHSTCESLGDAVNWVGFREVHRLVGLLMSEGVLGGVVPVYQLADGELWRYSLAVAVAAEGVALASGCNRETAYTVGLLHSIGRVVINRYYLQRDLEVFDLDRPLSTLPGQEREVLGFHHGQVGAALLKNWSFPERIYVALQFQYEPLEAPCGETRHLAGVLYLARWVAASLEEGGSWGCGEVELEWDFSILEAVRLSESQLEACIEETGVNLKRSMSVLAA